LIGFRRADGVDANAEGLGAGDGMRRMLAADGLAVGNEDDCSVAVLGENGVQQTGALGGSVESGGSLNARSISSTEARAISKMFPPNR